MGKSLLPVSQIVCSGPDCQFPASVPIRTKENRNGEIVNMLILGRPKLGESLSPKFSWPKKLDRIQDALKGKWQWEKAEGSFPGIQGSLLFVDRPHGKIPQSTEASQSEETAPNAESV